MNCEKCKLVVSLWPENEEALQMIEAAGPALISPNGTINGMIIETVMNIHQVDRKRRSDLLEKFNVYLSALLEHIKNEGSG